MLTRAEQVDPEALYGLSPPKVDEAEVFEAGPGDDVHP